MNESTIALHLTDEAATSTLGAALAEAIRAISQDIEASGLHVAVAGELGSGKTTLVRATLRRLGVSGAVKSPSFALLEPYEVSRLHLYHFDFYRFKIPREFAESGFLEFFEPGNVCIVEWPERAGDYLPTSDLSIRLSVLEIGRSAQISANTRIGEQCLCQLRNCLEPERADD